MPDKEKYNVLITSYLEPEHVARIRAVDPERLNVIFEPALIGSPRYPADHYADPERTPAEEARWRELLGQADILFDFDYTHRHDLPDLAPAVCWVQSTSAGIGQYVHRYGYDTRWPGTTFTTASGVHARPLAEYVMMVLMAHYKGLRQILEQQQQQKWQRLSGTDLEGRTMAIVGLGRIGSQVAAMARALGMRVIGTNARPAPDVVDRYYPPAALHEMLSAADVVVLAVPHTPETEKMIGALEFAQMPEGAFFINIARGAIVDQAALVDALNSGHLGGAALDVFAEEPLPAASPLWQMDNVLVSPHSASTSDRENRRITALFCDNLQRFLDKRPLRNVLNTELMY